jgi:hypothetical protein
MESDPGTVGFADDYCQPAQIMFRKPGGTGTQAGEDDHDGTQQS